MLKTATVTAETDVSLRDIEKRVAACTACRLHSTRTNTVPGSGNSASGIMIIGEGPGQNEDIQGIPFIGACGHLLDRLLAKAGIHQSDVYGPLDRGAFVSNIIKCRPPGNRDPEPDEIKACAPFLREQIETIRPKVIIAVGKFATCNLTLQFGTMGSMLAKTGLVYRTPDGESDIPAIPIYHPSYLLRQGQGKSPRAKALFQDTVDRLAQARDIAHLPMGL